LDCNGIGFGGIAMRRDFGGIEMRRDFGGITNGVMRTNIRS